MSTQTEEARVYDPRFAKLTEDQRELLFGYVSDMVALDSDIEAALDKQLGLTKSDSLAGPLVRGFHDAVRDQRNMMVDLRNGLGEEQAASALKEKGATVIGAVTGVIDKFRSEGIAKALRDDYTAFNLAAVSYTMLMTTAKAAGSPDVVSAAEKGLRIYAASAQKINQAIPSVVLAELASKGQVSVSAEIADDVRRTVDGIWKATDQSTGAS
jgi:ferritin-like metal-binding protein YciE